MKLSNRVNYRITGILASILLLFIVDAAEAQYSGEAMAHNKRSTRRRTAVVVSSATHAKDEQAAAEAQQAEAAPAAEEAPATEQAPASDPGTVGEPAPASATQPAPATTAAPAPQAVPAGTALPIGTVVTTLPGGCEPTPYNNVQYYHCGADYYRTAYQGNNLVYVTAEPPQ